MAVYATVTGPDGRLVPDLPRDAFAIDDNGKRQDITLFANTIQPITAVVLLDRSGSMRANFRLVEQAAERFVDALQPGDKARIGSFSNRIQIDPRDFTSDHGELLTILKSELQPEGPTPLWNAIYVGMTALLHQQGRRVILVFTDGMDSPQGADGQFVEDGHETRRGRGRHGLRHRARDRRPQRRRRRVRAWRTRMAGTGTGRTAPVRWLRAGRRPAG